MTARERLRYLGDHDAYLPGSTGARPDLVQPERPDPDDPDGKRRLEPTIVEVNEDAVAGLVARGDFELIELAEGEEPQEVPLAVEEPVPLDRQVALEEAAPVVGVAQEEKAATGKKATPVASAEETLAELTAGELDDALSDAGLPQVGTEEEKRERLLLFYRASAHSEGTTTTAISLHALQQALDERARSTTTTSTER